MKEVYIEPTSEKFFKPDPEAFPAHEDIADSAAENCEFDLTPNGVRALTAEFNSLLKDVQETRELLQAAIQLIKGFVALAEHAVKPIALSNSARDFIQKVEIVMEKRNVV